jgi:cytochrome P450
MRRRPPETLAKIAHRYGDIVHMSIQGRHLYLLNRPEFIEDVLITHNKDFVKGQGLQRTKALLGEGLLTSEGDFHLRQRRLIQPVFHRQQLNQYGQVMVEAAEQASERWSRQAGADGSLVIDVEREMKRLALAIAGRTLFNADVEADASEVGQALSNIMELQNSLFARPADSTGLLGGRIAERFAENRERLDRIVYRLIAGRRKMMERGQPGPDDVLGRLLKAQDAEDGSGMSDQQVRDEVLTLFLAGHETTANALTWTWYLLSQNLQVEAYLHQEVDRVLSGNAPGVADLENLPYTHNVFTESMRIYPPAWIIGRQVQNEYEVGGYILPVGSGVLLSQWVMHHDPRYYPDPWRFDPDRWQPEQKSRRPKFAYFPFGAGPRQCIGENFAWMEGELVLAALARSWQMRLMPGQKIDIRPRITLRPKYPILMRLERRL